MLSSWSFWIVSAKLRSYCRGASEWFIVWTSVSYGRQFGELLYWAASRRTFLGKPVGYCRGAIEWAIVGQVVSYCRGASEWAIEEEGAIVGERERVRYCCEQWKGAEEPVQTELRSLRWCSTCIMQQQVFCFSFWVHFLLPGNNMLIFHYLISQSFLNKYSFFQAHITTPFHRTHIRYHPLPVPLVPPPLPPITLGPKPGALI